MFVLDFIPKEYLKGGAEKSIAIFTAGWAMKFVPLLGRALKEMVLNGESEYALKEFSINRKDPKTGQGVIANPRELNVLNGTSRKQLAKGSSIRATHSII
jgi:sarcosine oxidase / L-pipecolate oxidase